MIPNYFDLFELKETFLVDPRLLKKQFHLLSKKFHPDFFVNENEEDRELVLEKTAAINKGYAILLNKEKTIEYVLELKGLIDKDEKYKLPANFLMEMMELNELIDTAKLDNNFEELDNCSNTIQALKQQIYEPVKAFIENYSGGVSKEEMLPVKEYFFKRKYIDRMEGNL